MYTGGCYCGNVRYEAASEPVMKAECLCRECQYITGGGPNFFMMVPLDSFRYVKGQAKAFTRSDIERPVTRQFCPDCGTHLATCLPGFDKVVVKIGTLDDPAIYDGPDSVIFACDRQPFHAIDPALPVHDKMAPR